MTEDEMVGWHHRLNGHEFDQALGDGEGQGSLACCSPWGGREFAQLVSIDLVMPSNHLILCHPLLLLPSVFPMSQLFASDGHSIGASASVLPMHIQG